jgi:hypothetical protein
MQDVGDNADPARVQYEVTYYRFNATHYWEKGGRDVKDLHPLSSYFTANYPNRRPGDDTRCHEMTCQRSRGQRHSLA